MALVINIFKERFVFHGLLLLKTSQSRPKLVKRVFFYNWKQILAAKNVFIVLIMDETTQ